MSSAQESLFQNGKGKKIIKGIKKLPE